MVRITLILGLLFWSTLSFAIPRVHTNSAGKAISITGLYLDGAVYNVTSFNGTGVGEVDFWPDYATATLAAQVLNSALNNAGITAVVNEPFGTNQQHCVGRTVGDPVGSSSLGGAPWAIDHVSAPYFCATGTDDYFTTWVVAPPRNSGTVHTDNSGYARAITNMNIGGTVYNVTSFNGTGAGEAFFWPDAASATAAANAVDAALNAAGIQQNMGNASTPSRYHCVGRSTGNVGDSVGSSSEPVGSPWQINTSSAAWACSLVGLGLTTTWEVVPNGDVYTNQQGRAIAIMGLEVSGIRYNVTSFNGTGAGSAFIWADSAAAITAAEAVNAALNAAETVEGVLEAETGGPSKDYHCVGLTSGEVADSTASTTLTNEATWQTDASLGPWVCGLGGLNFHTTWQPVGPALPADISVFPGGGTNSLHAHHDNDLISLVIYRSSLQVGDPIELNTDTIDPATVKLGPAQASIAPNSIPEFNIDYDNDGLNDAMFEFNMGDTGISCTDQDMAAIGSTISDETFGGIATIVTDCDAGCH